jgi:outer membrane immunogenic protein
MPGAPIMPLSVRLTCNEIRIVSNGAAMTKIWLTTALTLLGSVSALAADLPARSYTKAPAMTGPVYNWTGFYVGGGFGYGAYQGAQSTYLLTGAPDVNTGLTGGGKGWLATVTAGYDLQVTDRLVVGVLVDYDFTEIKGTVVNLASADPISRGLSDAWSVGGRLGFLVTPATLAYMAGGYTQGDFRADAAGTLVGNGVPQRETASTHKGWFAGFGLETMFGENWSGRLEYRYASYNAERGTRFLNSGVPGGLVDTDPVVQTMRASLAYKFGGTGLANANAMAYAAPAVPASSWTGLSLGAGVGYGSFQTESVFRQTVFPNGIPDTHPINSGGKGVLATLAIGYDLQFADRFVAGVLADYDFASADGTYLHYSNAADLFSAGKLKQQSAWAVGGRVGYLATQQSLFYATGGYTEAQFGSANFTRVNIFSPPLTVRMSSQNYSGWFAGAGIETQFAPNWSMRVEYRYAEYGSERVTTPPLAGGISDVADIKPTVQTVRAGISYKFGGPVMSQY